MHRGVILACALLAMGSAAATAADCPGGRPDALGVSRTIVVDPHEHPKLGTMQYSETLPLNDKEVVLTFDDGPIPRYSDRILEILAADCVKATYFVVGKMAKAYPDVLRRIYAAGHTIGTHSLSHPFTFHKMSLEKAEAEIQGGIDYAAAALGDPNAVAPFFRIPGLLRADQVETYLTGRGIMTWSADFPADDWKRKNTDRDIARLALERLEAKGKGILLLHDIHPATVLALPVILRELKARGYKIVHVVPAGADRPKTATLPSQWRPGASTDEQQGWPRVLPKKVESTTSLPVIGLDSIDTNVSTSLLPQRTRVTAGQIPLPPTPPWPRAVTKDEPATTSSVPAPAPTTAALPAPDAKPRPMDEIALRLSMDADVGKPAATVRAASRTRAIR